MRTYRFLQHTLVLITYTWRCDGGCCSNEEVVSESFEKGDFLALYQHQQGYYSHYLLVDLDNTEQASRFNYMGENATPRIHEEEIQELISDGFLCLASTS
jgi:hypothetical protein